MNIDLSCFGIEKNPILQPIKYVLHLNINSLPRSKFFMFFVICDFFFEINLFEKSFQEYHQSVNSLDPDQTRCFVGPDLVLDCLQKLAGDTRRSRDNSVCLIIDLFVLSRV